MIRTLRRTGALILVVLAACRPGTLEVGSPSVAFGGTPQSADPGLALDPDTGDLLAVWVGGDGADTTWSLYFARSADGGAAWTQPVAVASGAGEVHPHGESSPRLTAAPGGRVAVAWSNSIKVEGRKWPAAMMRLARSKDGGATWFHPVTINDDTTARPVSHQFHGLARQGDSSLVVAWLDERAGPALAVHHGDTHGDPTSEPDATIYLASSPDFGRTWSLENQPLWGQACPCCRVSLAREPDGGVMSAWRMHFPGNIRDVVTARVQPGTPVEPVRIHEDGWVYPGCPHTGPALAVDDRGELHVAWYTGKEGAAGVLYRRVAWNGAPVGRDVVVLERGTTLPTAHVAVAATPAGGALAAFDVSVDGTLGIVVSHIRDDGVVAGRAMVATEAKALYPQLAVLGEGQAVLLWTTAGDVKRVYRAPVRFVEQAGPAGTVAVAP